MKARHAAGDLVTARAGTERWREAVVREVHHIQTWIEYKVSFRKKKGGEWGRRVYWAEVQREEARR
jgi:hypothetical protein